MEFTPVTDADTAFGIRTDWKKLYEECPDEFKKHGNPWCETFSQMFFSGFKKGDVQYISEDAEEIATQNRFLRAHACSWEPKHEHKEAICAWIMSHMFKEPYKK